MVDKKALWAGIACHFGLKLNEVFRLKDMEGMRYRITEEGLQCCSDDIDEDTWVKSCVVAKFLQGELGDAVKLKWSPSKGELYYMVSKSLNKPCHITARAWYGHDTDYNHLMIDNVFKTAEEAEKAIPMFKEKLKESLNAYGKV